MKNQETIDVCHACSTACESCATACLQEEEVEMMTYCIALTRSCADVCDLAAREMARESEFADQICDLCADICQACGDECAQHDVEHCKRCAAVCHRCADACRLMAAF